MTHGEFNLEAHTSMRLVKAGLVTVRTFVMITSPENIALHKLKAFHSITLETSLLTCLKTSKIYIQSWIDLFNWEFVSHILAVPINLPKASTAYHKTNFTGVHLIVSLVLIFWHSIMLWCKKIMILSSI